MSDGVNGNPNRTEKETDMTTNTALKYSKGSSNDAAVKSYRLYTGSGDKTTTVGRAYRTKDGFSAKINGDKLVADTMKGLKDLVAAKLDLVSDVQPANDADSSASDDANVSDELSPTEQAMLDELDATAGTDVEDGDLDLD